METKEEKESTQKLAGCVSSEEIFRGKRKSPKEQKKKERRITEKEETKIEEGKKSATKQVQNRPKRSDFCGLLFVFFFSNLHTGWCCVGRFHRLRTGCCWNARCNRGQTKQKATVALRTTTQKQLKHLPQ